MPSFSICARSRTSISTPLSFERCPDAFDEAFGVDDVCRLGDELAGQRNAFDDRRPARVRSAARRPAAADDDHFVSVGF